MSDERRLDPTWHCMEAKRERRRRVEEAGLEESFRLFDTQAEGNRDPQTRYEVADAETQTVCYCACKEYAALLVYLLNEACE